MVIVSHRVMHSGAESCFSLQWCQLCTKGYYHYTGWRNVKYFIIFCQPLWEPALPACFGGGIYRGHGINADPTHLLGNWDVFILHFRVWERKRRGGEGGYDWVTMTMNTLNVVFSDSDTGSPITQFWRAHRWIPCAWIKVTLTHSFTLRVAENIWAVICLSLLSQRSDCCLTWHEFKLVF